VAERLNLSLGGRIGDGQPRNLPVGIPRRADQPGRGDLKCTTV